MNARHLQAELDTFMGFRSVNTESVFALSDTEVMSEQIWTHKDMYMLVSDTSCPYLENHLDQQEQGKILF